MAAEDKEEEGKETEVEEFKEAVEEPEEGKEDERLADKEEEEAHDPLATDEERQKIREARRQERKDRVRHRKEREDSLRRELAARDHIIGEMQERLALVERKGQTTDVAQLDEAINNSANTYNHYKARIAEATAVADGASMADSMEKMLVAQRKYEELNKIKAGYTKSQNQAPAADPKLIANAKAFMERHTWYDPSGKDEDSEITMTLDRRLMREGWNPTTPQYWEELDSRLRNRLPHRFTAGYNTRKDKTSSPVGGSDKTGGPSKSSFKLSADRVQALKDAGKWNDPKERERMITYYRNFDKQAGA